MDVYNRRFLTQFCEGSVGWRCRLE